MDIIKALEESKLVGLGGAGFSVAEKWKAVKSESSNKCFVICNLSESEPGVFKDEFIIQRYLEQMISGIEVAQEFLSAQKSYIFLADKFIKYQKKIKKHLRGKKIEIFIDTGRYICGEETVMLQVLERKIRQPRNRPPYPTKSGLFGCPTLINNAETFYRVKLVADGNYQPKRFYSLSGDHVRDKIVEASIDSTVKEIIGSTNIISKTKFVRVGGLSGYFLPKNNFDQQVSGVAAIELFGHKRRVSDALIESISFLKNESCGKCTPCREGSYRILEDLRNISITKSLWDKEEVFERIKNISDTAKISSFCSLGRSICQPVDSAIDSFSEEF